MSDMTITFWGVRGSIASPGPRTSRVGGNTSSVEIRCGDTVILLDAGTGLREAGQSLLMRGAGELTLLLSHLHWDHIQGLPFFLPAYVPTTQLAIVGPRGGGEGLRPHLEQQMSAPGFPVSFADLPARIATREIGHGAAMNVGGAQVRAAKLNHPGGVLGYRVDFSGRSVVYATDTEHYACVDPVLRDLAEDADVLIYDAQYTPEEYAGVVGRAKTGWGHSTYEAAVEVARSAGVKELVLFHHDPQHDDQQVAEIEARARRLFGASRAAREGEVIEVAVARAVA